MWIISNSIDIRQSSLKKESQFLIMEGHRNSPALDWKCIIIHKLWSIFGDHRASVWEMILIERAEFSTSTKLNIGCSFRHAHPLWDNRRMQRYGRHPSKKYWTSIHYNTIEDSPNHNFSTLITFVVYLPIVCTWQGSEQLASEYPVGKKLERNEWNRMSSLRRVCSDKIMLIHFNKNLTFDLQSHTYLSISTSGWTHLQPNLSLQK